MIDFDNLFSNTNFALEVKDALEGKRGDCHARDLAQDILNEGSWVLREFYARFDAIGG